MGLVLRAARIPANLDFRRVSLDMRLVTREKAVCLPGAHGFGAALNPNP